MGIGKIILIGVGVAAGGVLIAAPTIMSMPRAPKPDSLMGENFFRIRREALAMFPRGSRLNDTAEGLVSIGFRCQGITHKIANVNADSLVCDSHGRGYPLSPTLTITVLARNGLVSDFEVSNMLQRADAETPEPPPPPAHGTAPTPEKGSPVGEKAASSEGKPAHAE